MRGVFKSEVYRKYFLRYAVVVVVAVVVLLAMSLSTLRDVYNRLDANTRGSLQVALKLLDSQIYELTELSLRIATIPELLPYNLNQRMQYPHEIVAQLERLRVTSGQIESIGLCYRRSPYLQLNTVIFTNTGYYDIQSFSKLVCSGKILPEQLQQAIADTTTPRHLSSINDTTYQDAGQVLLLLVPLNGTASSSGVMIYKVNYAQQLMEIASVGLDSNVIAVDRSGVVLNYTERLPARPYSSLTVPEQTNGAYLYMREESPKSGHSVAVTYERKEYYAEYYGTAYNYGLILLVTLLVGIVISLYSALITYAPIRQLSQSLPSGGFEGNEFDRLGGYLVKVREENSRLSQTMQSQETRNRNQFLMAMLLGKSDLDNLTVSDNGLYQQLVGSHDFGCVMILLFDGVAAQTRRERQEQWLMKYAVSNVLEELPNTTGVQYGLDLAVDDGVTVIVLGAPELLLEQSRILAQQIIDFMNEHFMVSMSCYIGDGHDINELFLSFNEATMLSEYRILGNRGLIVTQESRTTFGMTKDCPEMSLVSTMNMALTRREYTEVKVAFYELHHAMVRVVDTDRWLTLYAETVFLLNRILNEHSIQHREELQHTLSQLFMGNRFRKKQMTALQCTAQLIFDELDRAVVPDDFSSMVKDYLDLHYSDSNLTLSVVSGQMQLTPSYLTRYFKKKNGISLMQYVGTLRLEHAKRLLEKTQLPIKEIVAAVGFVDENNFSRSFRKKEGISPSSYRQANTNHE